MRLLSDRTERSSSREEPRPRKGVNNHRSAFCRRTNGNSRVRMKSPSLVEVDLGLLYKKSRENAIVIYRNRPPSCAGGPRGADEKPSDSRNKANRLKLRRGGIPVGKNHKRFLQSMEGSGYLIEEREVGPDQADRVFELENHHHVTSIKASLHQPKATSRRPRNAEHTKSRSQYSN